MYKLQPLYLEKLVGVTRFMDSASLPIDPNNTDYQKFKRDVLEGAELQDVDGNQMNQEVAKEFVRGLP